MIFTETRISSPNVNKPTALSPFRMSVDLEDWHHTIGDTPHLARSLPQVTRSVELLLELLRSNNCFATFFAVGELAKQLPSLVRRISDAGHEIASHSLNHSQLHQLTPTQLARDLTTAKQIIEDTTGRACFGVRAPYLSPGPLRPYLSAVAAAGYLYDSSYAALDVSPQIHHTASGPIWSLPVSRFRTRFAAFPLGGAYLRIVHREHLRRCLQEARRTCHGLSVYLHPYEFAGPLIPYSAKAWFCPTTIRRVLVHNVGTNRLQDHVRWLLSSATWTTFAACVPKGNKAGTGLAA